MRATVFSMSVHLCLQGAGHGAVNGRPNESTPDAQFCLSLGTSVDLFCWTAHGRSRFTT
jgi:hypothetical protein